MWQGTRGGYPLWIWQHRLSHSSISASACIDSPPASDSACTMMAFALYLSSSVQRSRWVLALLSLRLMRGRLAYELQRLDNLVSGRIGEANGICRRWAGSAVTKSGECTP